MQHLQAAIDIYENLISRDMLLAYPECPEKCANCYIEISRIFRRMGLEKERVPMIDKAIALYEKATELCDDIKYQELCSKIKTSHEVKKMIIKDLQKVAITPKLAVPPHGSLFPDCSTADRN